ncbi:hypothetical protein [Bacillus sp. CHD6a]|uniref:hypothetical protein n=1 Tax=Bacillus sp. CHD6a TaxID=1643452 RepID=UPI0006CC41BE|nr:hypothetical protein [Bacillus sp. CHD6a]KPB06256.1 hypothetical protein AAV98_00120 [Bacillus sp. CHD6a]
MIEIIYDVSTLEGSCYIEILPDKYKGDCWSSSSIFFSEDNFSYIMPIFEKCFGKFDYYAFNEIDIETWKSIIKELQKMKDCLSNNPKPNSLKAVIGFPFIYSEEEFMGKFTENYDKNIQQLITMITEFQNWIEAKIPSTKVISVLGM